MKGKKLSYIKNIIKFCILIFVILVINASSSKTETYSSNENINRSVDLSTMALFINKEEEAKIEAEREALQKYLWGTIDSYTGDLTGYAADCPLCTGRLACMSSLDLSGGRTTYNDKTYGEIRIVASSKNLPCGSIIRFESKNISNEPVIAIVLDRGVLGNDIDLLTPSESYALKYVGRRSITYDVLRSGWEK